MKTLLNPKVAVSGGASAVALIILWAISRWVTVPVEVGSAFTAVLSLIGGYLAPWIPKPPVTK